LQKSAKNIINSRVFNTKIFFDEDMAKPYCSLQLGSNLTERVVQN